MNVDTCHRDLLKPTASINVDCVHDKSHTGLLKSTASLDVDRSPGMLASLTVEVAGANGGKALNRAIFEAMSADDQRRVLLVSVGSSGHIIYDERPCPEERLRAALQWTSAHRDGG